MPFFYPKNLSAPLVEGIRKDPEGLFTGLSTTNGVSVFGGVV